MRRVLTMISLLALAATFACGGGNTNTTAPSANGAAANANAPGAREGTGPAGTGIGGTSDANRSGAVNGNSNV